MDPLEDKQLPFPDSESVRTVLAVFARDEAALRAASGKLSKAAMDSRWVVKEYSSVAAAVKAAVSTVQGDRLKLSAAVYTAEESVAELVDHAQSCASFATAGQVVIPLGVHETVRRKLTQSYSFEALGTHVGHGEEAERLFLVKPRSEVPKVAAVETDSSPSVSPEFVITRSKDQEALRQLINVNRLITIHGTTGTGKTTLLKLVTNEIGDDFPDGTATVDLSNIASGELVLSELLRVFEIRKLPEEEATDALVHHLRRRHFLLVLDSCERVTSDLRKFAEKILKECPNVQILCGSQKRLRSLNESVYRLGGMETPTYAENWNSVKEYESVRLFEVRAEMGGHKFQVNEENSIDVARICHALDGNPLALDLAASRIEYYSPAQIVGRLSDRHPFLKDLSEQRPLRHRSLGAAVEWSRSLLSDNARLLMNRISIFEGSFTIEMVESICADEHLDRYAAADALEELSDSAIVSFSNDKLQERRFLLPETFRIVGEKELKKSKEDSMMRSAHQKWCLEFLDRATLALNAEDQAVWLERVDANYKDFKGQIRRLLKPGGDLGSAIDLLIAIFPFWYKRAYHAEGLELAREALQHQRLEGNPKHAVLLNLASALSSGLGDLENARLYATESYVIAKSEQQDLAMAKAANSLGLIWLASGSRLRARRCFKKAASLFKKLSLDGLRYKALTSIVGLGFSDESDRVYLDQALTLDAVHGDPWTSAILYNNAAGFVLRLGRIAESKLFTDKSFDLFRQVGDDDGLAHCLGTACDIATMEERFELAAVLEGTVGNLMESIEVPLLPNQASEQAERRTRCAQILGPDHYQRLIFEGRAMTREAALNLAIEYVRDQA